MVRAFAQVHPLTFDEYESPTGVRDYLIQFRGDGDDYCKFMEPLKERVRPIRRAPLRLGRL